MCAVLHLLRSEPLTLPVTIHNKAFEMVFHLHQRPEDAVADFIHRYATELGPVVDMELVHSSIYTKLCVDIAASPIEALVRCDGRASSPLLFTTEIDNLGLTHPTIYVRAGYDLEYYIGAVCELVVCNDAMRFAVRKGLHPHMFEPTVAMPEVAAFVNIRSGWNELNHLILLRNETDDDFFIPLVESYCWVNAYMYRCRAIVQLIRDQIATPGAWQGGCGGVPGAAVAESGGCRAFALRHWLSWRVEFGEDYNRRQRILNAHGLSTVITNREYRWNVEGASLEALHRLLAERDCVSDEAGESLDRGGSRAKVGVIAAVPCSRSLWAPGRWQLRQSQEQGHVGVVIVRCLGELIGEGPTPGGEHWPLVCPDHIPGMAEAAARTATVAVSEVTLTVPEGEPGCVVYSFDSQGGGSVFGSACEVVTVDAADADGSVPLFLPEGLPSSALRPPNTSADEATLQAREQRLQTSVAALVGALRSESRPVTALSVRCAGCEWVLLDHMARVAPDALEGVCGMALDLHMSTQHVNTSYDLYLLARFQEEFIERRGFRVWYRRAVPGQWPQEWPRTGSAVHPLLADMGFPEDVESYELILRRPDCVPGDGGDRAQSEDVPPAPTNSWLPAGLSGFRETHQFISGANLTVGVLQRLGTVHSELIGPMVELLREAGFGHVIVYFDVGAGDNFVAAGLFAGWESWDVRPARACLRERDQWDFLLMTTGDEVVYGGMQAFAQANADRILAIQHHKFWTEPAVLTKNLYLTPAEREHLFLFPFMTLTPAAVPADLSPRMQLFAAEAEKTGQFLQSQQSVLLLGTVGDHRDLKLVNRVKDMPDVLRFLAHNASNFVLNIAREALDFGEALSQFPLQSALLEAVSSEELRLLLETLPVDFVWVPVAPHSHYTRAFASSIAFAFAFRKVLLMPRHLAELYGLSSAVVMYNTSLTEVDFGAATARRGQLLARMNDWERAQRVQNVINMYKCITSKCL